MKFTRQQWAWLLYDPANSAYALIVRTVFAPLFFTTCVSGIYSASEITSRWSICASAAGIAAGILSVLCGPLADARQQKRLGVAVFAAAGIFSTLALIFIPPLDHSFILPLSFTGLVGFMVANSFYDAMLTDVTQPDERDRVSTAGYAFGYAGGVFSFLLTLPFVFLCTQQNGFRWAFLIAALWWLLGSIPLLTQLREKPLEHPPVKIAETLKFIGKNKNILCFLIAYFLYIDGVGTILLAATPLAGNLQIPSIWLLLTILALQFIGLPCTLLYGRLAARFSARKMIYAAIAVYILIALLVTLLSIFSDLSLRRGIFILCAALIGSSQGGIQSLSRSLFSRLIPHSRAAELFGVYNIFGKFTTIVGPLFILLAHHLFRRSELGITMLIAPFLLGALLLSKVKIPESGAIDQ